MARLTKKFKRQIQAYTVDEAQLEEARQAILQARKDKAKYSIRQAALDYNVSESKLERRMRGILDRRTAHMHQQLLLPAEEENLTHWVLNMAEWATPVSLEDLRQTAHDILQQRKPLAAIPGDSWAKGFEARHPEVARAKTIALERARADGLSQATTTQHFKLLKEWLEKNPDLPPQNVFNMDEKGFMLGKGRRESVYVGRGTQQNYIIEGNQPLFRRSRD
jgi:hypothetical protein